MATQQTEAKLAGYERNMVAMLLITVVALVAMGISGGCGNPTDGQEDMTKVQQDFTVVVNDLTNTGEDMAAPADMSPGCISNPTTHIEIINACTTADKIDKVPVLPLLLGDGGLPPLP